MTVFSVAIWLAGIAVIGVAGYALHRWLLSLERRGYIYYLEKPRGGGGGNLFELDKLTRPSIEHVVRAMEADVEAQENEGE